MSRLFKSRKRIAALGVVAAISVAAVAFAFWSSTGSGLGSASTGDVTNLTVSIDSSPSDLYPGGDAQDVDWSVTNNDPGQESFSSADLTIESVTPAACDASNFTVTDPSVTSVTLDGAGGANDSASYTGTDAGTIKLDETGVNQDDCKNATVDLKMTVNP
jgi:hypothetical protein